MIRGQSLTGASRRNQSSHRTLQKSVSPTHLREVPHQVEPQGVKCDHDVKEEGICVIVQGVAVQEELRHKTEVLAVGLIEQRRGDQTYTTHVLLTLWHTLFLRPSISKNDSVPFG